jgi:glyoxylase-like metal-dependent hydrolase (beta-lactamase superfamily II)
MSGTVWRELADGVFLRSHVEQRLNVGLIVGSERCLVIDTRSTHVQAEELATAIRQVTARPWLVANTHAHWDHCFGNAQFRPADIWGHRRCATMLQRYGDIQRELIVAAAADDEPVLAQQISSVELVPPNRTFETDVTLDLGDRLVHLRHLGLGHTDNDVVAEVPDAEVIFAGDLVEEGEPPEFADSFPLDWPETLDRLLGLARGKIVPGHGVVVDADFVSEQSLTLGSVATIAREAHADRRVVADVIDDVPLPERAARLALTRAYRQLDGAPPYDSPEEVRSRFGLPM